MPDELESAVLEPEAEAPIIENDEPTDPGLPEEDAEISTEDTEAPAEPEDDLEDVEWNGKTFKAPKGVKDSMLMHADYTRKRQEDAAFRRELEQKAQTIAQQAQLGEEELNLRANYVGLGNELQRFQNVNWEQLERDDPIEAGALYRRFTTLRDQAVSTAYRLNQIASERTEQAKLNEAKRLQETHEYARTKIPGWSPDVDQKVTEFATKELGFDWDTLKSAYTPQVYRALHLAWLGHQAMKKPAASAPNKVPPKPLETVGARSNPSARKSISDMSMEEYAEYRRKGGRG